MAKFIPATADDIFKKIVETEAVQGPKANIFEKVCEIYRLQNHQECTNAALHAYNADEVENISLFKEAVPLFKSLKSQKIKIIVVSSGIYSRQMKKVQLLGLQKFADLVLIHDL